MKGAKSAIGTSSISTPDTAVPAAHQAAVHGGIALANAFGMCISYVNRRKELSKSQRAAVLQSIQGFGEELFTITNAITAELRKQVLAQDYS